MPTTFYSPHRHLIINAEPKVPRIEFVNGLFATEDPKQIELLRKHPGYGRYIFENQSGVVQQAEETKPAQQPRRTTRGRTSALSAGVSSTARRDSRRTSGRSIPIRTCCEGRLTRSDGAGDQEGRRSLRG